MADNKTNATQANVDDCFAAIADEGRCKDCVLLAKLMAKATGQPPVMWGTSIVGFGSYHYTYDSGREGDSCLTEFASRKGDIALYLTAEVLAQKELLSKLGKHKVAKGCLHIRNVADVGQKVLAQLVRDAAAERKACYGQG
jgi:hypothetical protein